MNFKLRRDQKELLDEPNIPAEDLGCNLRELDVINRYLGGHRITLNAVRRLAQKPLFTGLGQTKPFHVCEIGCGGGDNLRVIDRWAWRKGIPLLLTGVDMKETCIEFARNKAWLNPVQWITSDYRAVHFESTPDILFSSLFCHHFSDGELPAMLTWMYERSSGGFFINDLHRHPLAYYSIKWLTRMFSRSYLVRNDAPLSVQRAFIRKDWDRFLKTAGIPASSVHWKWAFRWLVLVPHTYIKP